MLIDCHTHVGKFPDHYRKEFLDDYSRAWKNKVGGSFERTLDDHFKAMKAVDRAIVFGLRARDSGFDVPNEYVSEYVNKHPDKLIGFASIDPNYDSLRHEILRCVRKLGLRGLKLGPIYQHFDPSLKKFNPIWETAQELSLPIVIHQGTTFVRNAPLKYAFPTLLEDIALRFPDLTVIVAHMGHPWEESTIALIRKQPNFYSDISGLTPRPYRLYNDLVLAMEYGVLDKLVFGSDYPILSPLETMQGLRKINVFAEGTNLPRVPEEKIEAIISQNAMNAVKSALG